MYLRNGRTQTKDFIYAIPAGKKGAELIWDLEAITAGPEKPRVPAFFMPNGPAYKLIDELFVLVLDDQENAAAKYFNLWPNAQKILARRRRLRFLNALYLSSPTCPDPLDLAAEWTVATPTQPKDGFTVTAVRVARVPAGPLP